MDKIPSATLVRHSHSLNTCSVISLLPRFMKFTKRDAKADSDVEMRMKVAALSSVAQFSASSSPACFQRGECECTSVYDCV